MWLRYSGKRMVNFANEFKIIGGVNLVDDKHWNKWKDNDTVKQMMDVGELEIVGEEKSDGASMTTKKSIRDAITMVEETVDLELLKEWEKSESARPGVKDAIQKQIKALEEPTQFKDTVGASTNLTPSPGSAQTSNQK